MAFLGNWWTIIILHGIHYWVYSVLKMNRISTSSVQRVNPKSALLPKCCYSSTSWCRPRSHIRRAGQSHRVLEAGTGSQQRTKRYTKQGDLHQ